MALRPTSNSDDRYEINASSQSRNFEQNFRGAASINLYRFLITKNLEVKEKSFTNRVVIFLQQLFGVVDNDNYNLLLVAHNINECIKGKTFIRGDLPTRDEREAEKTQLKKLIISLINLADKVGRNSQSPIVRELMLHIDRINPNNVCRLDAATIRKLNILKEKSGYIDYLSNNLKSNIKLSDYQYKSLIDNLHDKAESEKPIDKIIVKILNKHNYENNDLIDTHYKMKLGFINSKTEFTKELENRTNFSTDYIQNSLRKQMEYCETQQAEQIPIMPDHPDYEPFAEPTFEDTPSTIAESYRQKTLDPRFTPEQMTIHTNSFQVSDHEVGIAESQAFRDTMEDARISTICEVTIGNETLSIPLFGVFDGHGGPDTANFVRDNIQQKFREALIEFNPNGLTTDGIWKALKITSVRLHEAYQQQPNQLPGGKRDDQGTTAALAIILDDYLWVANLGDSRVILNNDGEAIQVSCDADPADERSKKKVNKRSGAVLDMARPGQEPNLRVNGLLAVPGAIGDGFLNGASFTRFSLTRIPLSELSPNASLIIGCDGLFDVATTEQSVELAEKYKHLPPKDRAEILVKAAMNAHTRDNVTVLVVDLFCNSQTSSFPSSPLHYQNSSDYTTSSSDELTPSPSRTSSPVSAFEFNIGGNTIPVELKIEGNLPNDVDTTYYVLSQLDEKIRKTLDAMQMPTLTMENANQVVEIAYGALQQDFSKNDDNANTKINIELKLQFEDGGEYEASFQLMGSNVDPEWTRN